MTSTGNTTLGSTSRWQVLGSSHQDYQHLRLRRVRSVFLEEVDALLDHPPANDGADDLESPTGSEGAA